jgi:hypothetical protein
MFKNSYFYVFEMCFNILRPDEEQPVGEEAQPPPPGQTVLTATSRY